MTYHVRICSTFTLVMTLLSVPLAAQTSHAPTPVITAAQAKKLRTWIVKKHHHKALTWLDAKYPKQSPHWCDIPTPKLSTSKTYKLHADLGVLARRTKRINQAMSCLFQTFQFDQATRRSAALFEAYQILPLLSQEQREMWYKRWEPQLPMQHSEGPAALHDLVRWINPNQELEDFTQKHILRTATLLRPTRDTIRQLPPQSRKHLPSKLLHVVKFNAQKSNKAARRSQKKHFLKERTHAPLCRQQSIPPDITSCVRFSRKMGKRIKQGAAKANLRHVSYEEYGTPQSCNMVTSVVLEHNNDWALMGTESDGDNCHRGFDYGSTKLKTYKSSPNSFIVDVWNTADGTEGVHDPLSLSKQKRQTLCQWDSKQTTLVCIQTSASNFLNATTMYSWVPHLSIEQDRLQLGKSQGGFSMPEYQELHGMTILEAAANLPRLNAAIKTRLGL